MEEPVRGAFAYCVQQVRQYDYLNYVWVSQAAKDLRPALFALRAFNIETGLVAQQVRSKEPAVGQIRFQWWRDAVRAAFEERPPAHPVALALAHVLHSPPPASTAGKAAAAPATQRAGADDSTGCSTACGSNGAASWGGAGAVGAAAGGSSGSAARFSRYSFKRIIDVREADFVDPQPPLDLSALEQYAEGTASQLLYLQLAAAGVKDREADHAASHLGRAAGIATLLRGTASHAASRRSYLPVDLCAESRVSQEDVYGGVVSEGLRDVVHKVASLAKGHLDEARRLAPRLPAGAAALMLPAVAVDRYLRDLEAANFDPWDERLQREHGGTSGGAPLPYVLSVKWHQLRGTY
ncbi:hypothetical protein GPECTOR_70g503 [Gonium pectorale]|uniref:Phytoene synthase n=1 Tax=Gonium pectorale TaxID=33097 RepID=A0A150G322_GONPE|nr:hypothetical protein GPECTOR_70g503 [Gonium pectorale]|eukprot:KXZ44272.1 hypothetical protein GPECTOR_70g503 [Gonium pectorale]